MVSATRLAQYLSLIGVQKKISKSSRRKGTPRIMASHASRITRTTGIL